MLIKSENVYLQEDNRSFIKCYYIDYNLFFNVVLYRIHLMQKAVISAEKTELHEVFYQCPTCKEKSSSLQAMRLRSKDGKFVCSHCCPIDNIREYCSEAYYTLVEVSNQGKLDTVQHLDQKMQQQLHRSRDREGIFTLLSKLGKFAPLPHNKPSENISSGVRNSAVVDADEIAAIEQNQQFANGEHGSSNIRKKAANVISSRAAAEGAHHAEFSISIETEEDAEASRARQLSAAQISDRAGNEPSGIAGRATNLPEFLQNSRVVGAANILRAAEAIQQERSGIVEVHHTDENPAKKTKIESESAVQASSAESKTEDAAGEDDVAWEDDDVAWEDEEEIAE